MIKNYRFASPGEELYPGLEITERWNHKRAWQWMATGPLKGRAAQTLYLGTTQLPGYNAVSLKLSYRDWVTDSTAFFNNLEEQLSLAATNRLTVMPVLLTDDDSMLRTFPWQNMSARSSANTIVTPVSKRGNCTTIPRESDRRVRAPRTDHAHLPPRPQPVCQSAAYHDTLCTSEAVCSRF